MDQLAFTHPELARRYRLLVERCWARSWDVSITSSSRSEATQRAWYALYLAGLWFVDGQHAIVADPDRDAGPTPFGWRAHGSLHMIQRDGYSHALDLAFAGPSHAALHALAATCGLRFPEPTEWWHTQAFDAYSDGLYPVEEDDMTPEQLGLIRDPDHLDVDEYGVMLLEDFAPATPTTPEVATYKWYRYDKAVIFAHQAFKIWSTTHQGGV